jgi:hypothetical protein
MKFYAILDQAGTVLGIHWDRNVIREQFFLRIPDPIAIWLFESDDVTGILINKQMVVSMDLENRAP